MNRLLLLRVPGGRFTPKSIPNLKLWLSASGLSGLAVNDPIGTWSDASGQGNNATQATTAAKPTAKLLGSRMSAWFDNSDDMLSLAGIPLGTVHTVFAVLNFDNLVDGVILGAAAASGYLFYHDAANLYYSAGGTFGSKAHGMVTGSTYVLEIVRDGTAVEQFRNGTSLGGITLGVNTSFGNLASVGSHTTPSNYIGAYFGEIVVYSTALSATDRAKVRRYLGRRHGVVVV